MIPKLPPPSLVFTTHCHHGRCLSSLRLYLQDGVSWRQRSGIFVRKDEDPLARQ